MSAPIVPDLAAQVRLCRSAAAVYEKAHSEDPEIMAKFKQDAETMHAAADTIALFAACAGQVRVFSHKMNFE